MAPGLGGTALASQFGVQLLGVVVVGAYAAIVTVGLLFAIRVFIPLRVCADEEEAGLDSSSHGESAFHH